ncbi:endoplasmic reticulum metallopeptidase 1-like [Anopheles maculipalpis]|uniref:endoplasmic reticulum metallopeptidase 1-like n=1 Tax=Anopheles maculipalpis TaxID=1496333 RepID=UPI0021594F2A|nr:endoplasmic reticulum metallopeptidase 1-like [Anopheles maculipalpis]
MPQPKRVRFKEDERHVVKNLHELHSSAVYGALLVVIGCGLLTSYLSTRLPPALTVENLERSPNAFIAERAWASLKTLNDMGPKPAGSQANEVMAYEFLLKEVQRIEASKHDSQQLELDSQTVTGAFSISLLNQSMTSMYRNVQNVVVRLVGSDARQALLLNCHFDTVASSPGASDDGASCAVMLEVLRVLSRQPIRTRHTVLFLFNGAEETMLQAAHGFITQHRWAAEVRAFLNLESSGSGGKEVLFQAGPHHPWLIEAYARAIRHPFAHTVGEEIFQLGLIPSDTDFRMFRDYGEVPGMDFAHIANGYRYHTRYDSMDFLSLEVLQRTGDNVLALTRDLAECDELAASKLPTGETVFFDFIGLVFVHYSVASGRMINLAIALLSVIVPLIGFSRIHFKDVLREVTFGLLGTVIGTIFSTIACTTMARQLDFFSKTMTWYTNTQLILGLYCCSALLAHCFVYLFLTTFYTNEKSNLSLGQMTQARLIGVNVFWSFVTLAATSAGYRSGYIPMVLLACSLASSLLNVIIKAGRTHRRWIYVHLAFQLPALLWSTNFYNVLVQLFVPITGRFGGSRNPEVFISLLAAAGTLLCCSYWIPFIGQLRHMMNFTAKLSAIIVLTLALACFSPLGLPYRDESMAKDPTPQRHYVTHTFRVFHDEYGLYTHSDAGFLFQEMDRNTRATLEEYVVQGETLVPMRQVQSCEKELFCALPFYSLWHQMRFNNYWLPGPEPIVDNMVTMAYLGTEQLDMRTQRLMFTLEGSIQSSIIIGPKEGVQLVGWSLLDHVPPPAKFAGRDGHFIFITHGLPGKAWNMTVDVQYDQPKDNGNLVDIVVTTKYWEYQHMHTADFEELLARFPSWAHVVPSVAVVSVFPL